jgi:hypothetical protein
MRCKFFQREIVPINVSFSVNVMAILVPATFDMQFSQGTSHDSPTITKTEWTKLNENIRKNKWLYKIFTCLGYFYVVYNIILVLASKIQAFIWTKKTASYGITRKLVGLSKKCKG